MKGQYRDAFGDPAYLDGALGRLETGQPLRAVDLDELSYAVGREAALKLARAVEVERAKTVGRRPRARGGVFGWFFAPITQAPDLPPDLIAVLRRIRDVQALATGQGAATSSGVLGRAGVRGIARRLGRGTRTAARVQSRAQARNATRAAARNAGRARGGWS